MLNPTIVGKVRDPNIGSNLTPLAPPLNVGTIPFPKTEYQEKISHPPSIPGWTLPSPQLGERHTPNVWTGGDYLPPHNQSQDYPSNESHPGTSSQLQNIPLNMRIPHITSAITSKLDAKLKAKERFTAIFIPEKGTIPWKEFPSNYHWKWDSPGYVQLPMSSLWTKRMIVNETRSSTVPRWGIIQSQLTQLKAVSQSGGHISKQLQAAVTTYNRKLSVVCNFGILEDKELSERLTRILPVIIDYCLEMPYTLGKSIPFLKKGQWHTLFLTRRVCASLLANAFLCTIPHDHRDPNQLPHFHFLKLFHEGSEGADRARVKVEKIKCVLAYFEQMSRADKEEHDKIISFERRCITNRPNWGSSYKSLCLVQLDKDGTIEDAETSLQADFANKYVGGGILSVGMVQEEIRFAICPDLIVSRLFTEVLGDDEVLVVTGAKQFSSYTGYRTSFKWEQNKRAKSLRRDDLGREMVELVAMDALFFKQGSEWTQYQLRQIDRELHKAQVAFYTGNSDNSKPVATGNWGCGAFNGDFQLKFIIQWLAASEVGRQQLVYYTVGDDKQHKEFEKFIKYIVAKKPTVGKMYKVLGNYEKGANLRGNNPTCVFDFVRKSI